MQKVQRAAAVAHGFRGPRGRCPRPSARGRESQRWRGGRPRPTPPEVRLAQSGRPAYPDSAPEKMCPPTDLIFDFRPVGF
jgi:hypothetical protein